MNRLEFERICQSALEGTCSGEEFDRLQEKLAASGEMRRVFRETFLMHEMLALEASSHAPLARSTKVVPIDALLRFQRRRALRVAVAAAAALVMLMAAVFQIIRAGVNAPPLRITAAPHTKYSVNHRDGNAASPDRLQPGAEVELIEGTLRLDFSNGVRSLVQAPARFTLYDPLKLGLHHGAARFEVPRRARGFTVLTPRIEAVDLGTEFGVIERPETLPQVHVFDGHVQVTARHGLRSSRVLSAGVAVEATIPGNLETLPADPSLFFDELPPDLPFVHLSFEPDADGGLTLGGCHPAVGSSTARLHPGGPGLTEGIVGKAARFHGRATPVKTDWAGIGGSVPRTICAWIRQAPGLPHRRYQTIAAWGDPTIGMAAKCEMLLFQPKAGGPTVLRLSFDQFLYSGSTHLADGRWHHVAAVCRTDPTGRDAPVVELYVDGQREIIDPRHSRIQPSTLRRPDTRIGSGNSMPLVIGYTDRPAAGRGFRGRIDELYVFEAALGQERIMELAAPPKQGGQ